MEKINKRVLPQFLKTTLTLLFALFLLLGPLSIDALASATSVNYEGNSKKFIFLPENTDLFQGFKGVMPGDELSQDINVSNTGKAEVVLYLRAELPGDANKDFLDQMQLTVYGLKGEQIYGGRAGETGSLSEGYSLGTIKPGDKGKLVVKLKVPIEMDNKYQSQVGKINWIFSCEELEEIEDDPIPLDPTPTTPSTPSTGDRQPKLLLLTVSIAAFVGIILILVCRIRQKRIKQ